MAVRVKICGITNVEDALAACAAGADALGLVLAPSSRQITPQRAAEIIAALPPLVQTVGVFVDQDPALVEEIRRRCGLDLIQLHGQEDENTAARWGRRAIKALRPREGVPLDLAAYPQATWLLDTYHPSAVGGTGLTFDWSLALEPARQRRLILAGGLTPDNVASAVAQVRPYAVDVSSGVEKEPGRKDHDKVARFIANAKGVGHGA